jgi:hypothetical protein
MEFQQIERYEELTMQLTTIKILSITLFIPITLSFTTFVQALEINENIKNGQYQNEYPDSIGVLIKRNKFSVYYDDSPSDPPDLVSRSGFKYIKSGVFYSSTSKKYYCLIDNSSTVTKKNSSTILYCSQDGWKIRKR